MFDKLSFSKMFSTLLIVIIGVHLVKSLNEINEKISNEQEQLNNSNNNNNSTSDKLEVGSSYRKTRLLTDLPAPIYAPSESKNSKKLFKSKKKKKKKNEDESEEEDDQEENCDEEEESGNYSKKTKKSQRSYYSKPQKPVIKYVPIPVYLNSPKPKSKPTPSSPSPYGYMNSLSMEDLMSLNMGMKNMPDTSTGGLMGMTGGSYGTMPMKFGSEYNLMGENSQEPGPFRPTVMGSTYGSIGKNQVIAHYVKTNQNYGSAGDSGYGSGVDNDCAPGYASSNGGECEAIDSNKDSYKKDTGAKYEMDKIGANPGSDYGNNNNNKVSKQKENTMSKINRKLKKRPSTTTTTEESTYISEEPDGELAGEQTEHMSKAKQIAKMLEMLDKWN